ncbi:MAG: hypothetical protein LDL39_12170 [Magnetospirillum sp.]|nr:hypothetical protein [Magnetospirillum sp.]
MSVISAFSMETIVFVLLIGLAGIGVHFRFNAKIAGIAPSMLTTSGIFATFLAIAMGLYGFDAKNIQSSVPGLLDGLRTAFWASVVGVGFALLAKLRFAIWGASRHKGDVAVPVGATIDDLVVHLAGLQRALVGGDDSTLITQLRLGRQENNDRLDGLRRSFDDFAVKVAENNTKALIEALEGVMRDFNAKINEQFGDNFKQLNQAVAAILVWQERYRDQVDQMIAVQERGARSLDQAAQRFQSLVDGAESYTRTAQDLSELLRAIEGQRAALEDSMNALGKLFATASRGLPELEARIVDFADQITRSAQEAGQGMQQAARAGIDALRDSVGQVVEGAGQQLAALQKSLQQVEVVAQNSARQIADGAIKAGEVMARSAQDNATAQKAALVEAQKTLHDGVRAANDGFNAQVQDMIARTREQVAALDLALQQELTNSLNTLGRQLTGLSQQFVDDYAPLTQRLRDLVAVAGKV